MQRNAVQRSVSNVNVYTQGLVGCGGGEGGCVLRPAAYQRSSCCAVTNTSVSVLKHKMNSLAAGARKHAGWIMAGTPALAAFLYINSWCNSFEEMVAQERQLAQQQYAEAPLLHGNCNVA
eukprot:jgi/Chlat1/7302/Chrsp58S06942